MAMIIRRSAGLLALLSALILSACGAAAPASPPAAATVAPTSLPAPTAAPTSAPTAAATPAAGGLTITDATGRTVTLARLPRTIVSLAPNTTELAFALGLGPQVRAVDDFSDYPADVQALPKLGGSNGSYNYEQIVALQPDLVLAAGITAPEAIAKLVELKQTVVVLGTPQTTLDSIFSDIRLLGQISGREAQAATLTSSMNERLDALKARLAAATSKPLVYWELDATDPAKPFTVGPGNFVGDLIALAGGQNAFATADSPFPQVSTEQVVAAAPAVIILSDAAYGTTVESVLQRPGWQQIPAVQQARVAPIDDNLVSRPGPRIIEGLEAVARIIHPELFT
jgi:iron complex transport system substrate-binding protein